MSYSYLVNNVLLATNTTMINASEMVCGCLEKSAALYWGNALSESAYWLSHFLDIVFVMTFVFGVVTGILLLLFADWLYHKKMTKKEMRQ